MSFKARREETVRDVIYVAYKIYQCNIHLHSRGLVYVQRFTNVNSSPLRRYSRNARGLSRRFINHLFLYYALRCSTGIPRAAILHETRRKTSKEKEKKKKKENE